MLALALSAALFVAAPSESSGHELAQLFGTWMDGGSKFLVLNADGSGWFGGEDVKWTARGDTLVTVSPDGESREMPYRLEKGKLVVQIEEGELTLTRQGSAKSGGGKKKRRH